MTIYKRTDKGTNGYVTTYAKLAGEIGQYGRVLEVGVQGGGSLELWQTLFPYYGAIVGVDVNPRSTWPEGTHRLVYDQADEKLPNFLRSEYGEEFFDLIIDDASHLGDVTEVTFKNLWPFVKPGRYYVIEDWGVGLPGVAPMHDPRMLDFVQELINKVWDDADEVTYSRGLVIVKKRSL